MITIKKGLDIPLAGKPKQEINNSPQIDRCAILGRDYVGIKPTMKVSIGDKVCKGDVLLEDKNNAGVLITSPISGQVVEINRGDKRHFISLVVERDDSIEAKVFNKWKKLNQITREEVIQQLQQSGLWTSLRTRPYNKIPSVDSKPDAIFVNAMDTNPLSIDAVSVLHDKLADFVEGVRLLGKLTEGKVFVCSEPKLQFNQDDLGEYENNKSKIVHKKFFGKHPAGLASTHIHYLYPVNENRQVWTINFQELIEWVHLFKHGTLATHRVVALAGPQVKFPRLISVPIGSCLSELVHGELKSGVNRIISGSVLSGHIGIEHENYLGRYHQQVSVLEEGDERPFLHYFSAGVNRFSSKPIYLSNFNKKKLWNFTTTQNGSHRAMVPIGSYEQVMPLDILITRLLRELIVGDTEKAQQLGCLELVEEDLALCTYVCPSKYEYGPILRTNLKLLEQGG